VIVNSATAGLQPPALSVASSPVGELRTRVLSAVAGTLNTSVADVQGRLRGGQSLADLARTVGLSRQELVASIGAAVAGSGRASPDLPLEDLVQRIADQRKRSDRSGSAPARPSGRGPAAREATPQDGVGQWLDVRL
jgi:hypothetical protein